MIRRLKKEILTDLPPKNRSKFILSENMEDNDNETIGKAFEACQDIDDMPTKFEGQKEEQEAKMQGAMVSL